MDFAAGPATEQDFAAQHHRLSTDSASPFVRWLVVQRRDATGIDSLVGCELRRIPQGGATILDRPEWLEVLHDRFGIELDPEERKLIWGRVQYSR
jgi:N-hydroxyarylamine O-acetyltransferase